MADADCYSNYIIEKIIIDKKSNNGGNLATVIKLDTNEYGEPIGQAHRNLMFDTREFKVELENCEADKIMADKIAANLYTQLENEGCEIFQFKFIIEHKNYGSTMKKDTGFTVLKEGHTKCNPTRRGWQVLVEWRDETTTWMHFKDVKEAIPIELAEYAVSNKIDDDPDFSWWVPYIFKKRDRIISKAKTKYWRNTHKYDVRLPKTAAEALEMYRQTCQPLWVNAINKNMSKSEVLYK